MIRRLNKTKYLLILLLLLGGQKPCPSAFAVEPQHLIKLPQWKITVDESMNVSGGARLQLLNKALDEAKVFNQADSYPQSQCLFELAIYYTDIGKSGEAEHYFKEAAEYKLAASKKILTTTSDIPGLLPAYSNAVQEREGKIHDLANCLSWLGRTCFAEKKYDEAAHSFNQAIELLDTDKDPDHEAIILPDTLLRAARVERILNHLNEAKKMEERARFILRHRRLEIAP